MSEAKGGRPSRFHPDLGQTILSLFGAGFSRREIANRVGIGLRTLQDWLRRGRAGDPRFEDWARRFEELVEERRLDRLETRFWREQVEARQRWQEFKLARQLWWLRRLGPREFWRRRLQWLAEHGHYAAWERTIANLKAKEIPHNSDTIQKERNPHD